EDMYAQDSIELLKEAGIRFQQHQINGIEVLNFARLLITSGLVLMQNITWISFHSIYDFGYLLKILTNKKLPQTEPEFISILKLYFINFYDLKLLINSKQNFKGGLQELAQIYNVERAGQQHQAGSDAHLTGKVFFALLKNEIKDEDLESFNCKLFGLLNATETSELKPELNEDLLV
ncbi:MAG: CCR4-NOT transcription complex subunit 8, partial [Paramarteilia canceri]